MEDATVTRRMEHRANGYCYRADYVLADKPGCVGFILLNPAGVRRSAPGRTMQSCLAIARRHDCGRAIVGNLFAWPARRPKDLRGADDPVGPGNDRALAGLVRDSDFVVCAWGGSARRLGATRAAQVVGLLRDAPCLYALGFTGRGQPIHPVARMPHRWLKVTAGEDGLLLPHEGPRP